MVAKMDLINDIVAEMGLDQQKSDRLKVVLTVKLQGFELVSSDTRVSTVVKDNDWIYKRFAIDMLASGLKESTVKQYVYIVRKFLNDSNMNYSSVIGQDVMDYLAIKQYRDGISEGYKAAIYKYLSVFFQWAYRKHHMETDVMRDVEGVKTKQKVKVRLSDEEVEKCRVVVRDMPCEREIDQRRRDKEAAILEFMLSVGPRVGEMQSVSVDDINWGVNMVRVWGEKTSKERYCYISPSCKIALLRYLNGRTSGYLFQGARGGRMCKQTLENIAKSIGERAGVNFASTVHVYRKTFASVLYRKTHDILLVAKMLGHTSTATTIKYYLCDDIDDTMNVMRKVA